MTDAIRSMLGADPLARGLDVQAGVESGDETVEHVLDVPCDLLTCVPAHSGFIVT